MHYARSIFAALLIGATSVGTVFSAEPAKPGRIQRMINATASTGKAVGKVAYDTGSVLVKEACTVNGLCVITGIAVSVSAYFLGCKVEGLTHAITDATQMRKEFVDTTSVIVKMIETAHDLPTTSHLSGELIQSNIGNI